MRILACFSLVFLALTSVYADDFALTKPELCSRTGTPFEATLVSIDWRGYQYNEFRDSLEKKLLDECKTKKNAYQIADALSEHCKQICPKATPSKSCDLLCGVYDGLNRAYLNGAVSAKKHEAAVQQQLKQCRSSLAAAQAAPGVSQPGNSLVKSVTDDILPAMTDENLGGAVGEKVRAR